MDLTLQYAASLNSQGASSLSDGNSLAAFEYFRNALEVIVLGIPYGTRILRGSPELAKASNSLLLEPHMFHCLLLTTDCANIQPPQRCSHVFSKAFEFQPRDDQRELALQIRSNIAIIFFNLAATIHQRALVQRHGDQALNVALELYDVGFDLLIQEEICCDDCSNNISLAILNNMAEVHWALSDFSRASRVLELQKGLLDIIFSNRRPHGFSEQEMEIFILNTELLQAPVGAAAA